MVRDEPRNFFNANIYHMKFLGQKNTPTTVYLKCKIRTKGMAHLLLLL